MEKLIDHHIKTVYLKNSPLSKFQFAYQNNKSTLDALHSLVGKIESSISTKEISLAAFLDIEGAFDNASHCSMKNAMKKHGFDKCTINWIRTMLKTRKITALFGGISQTRKTIKGCPQGGILSPVLWSLTIDNLLTSLTERGFEVVGFADDVVIIIRGKFDSVISNRMQSALNHTLKWCRKEGLNINPSKTIIIPFTRKRKYTISKLQFGGIEIKTSTETKFLGVIFDQKLNWHVHIEQTIKKPLALYGYAAKQLEKIGVSNPT